MLYRAVTLFITFLWLLLAGTLAWSATPGQPAWTIERALPQHYEVPVDDIKGGAYFLLVDTQVKVDPDGTTETFQQFAIHIQNQTGLEQESQISIEFDPGYQDVTLHSVEVHRNGEVLDRLASARIDILQRETEMESLIRDGRKTLSAILSDIRVGDLLVYRYSISGENPIHQNLFARYERLNWTVPVAQVYVDVFWNKESPLFYRLLNTDLNVTAREYAGGTHYSVSAIPSFPVLLEEDTPGHFQPFAEVQWSEFSDWQAVVNWALPLYETATVTDDAVADIIREIQQKHDTPEEQLLAALQFTQNEIRYLGLELGEDSHRPTPAGETLRLRLGDCKDKTVLLNTLLAGLGIDAYPALVNTWRTAELPKDLPSSRVFDHVISYVELGDRSYWLDPTLTEQYGTLDTIHQPDYGHALIIRPGSNSLTEMPTADSSVLISSMQEFDLRGGPDQPVPLSITTEYFGVEADYQRSYINSDGLTEIDRSYLGFYEDYYGDVESAAPLSKTDDRQSNTLTTVEKYRLNSIWDVSEDGTRETWFHADSVYSQLRWPESRNRTQPYSITFPQNLKQASRILLPDDVDMIDPESFTEDNDFFRFRYHSEYDSESHAVTLNYEYENKVAEVMPGDISAYMDALDRVESHTSYVIYHNQAANWLQTPLNTEQIVLLVLISLVLGYVLLLLLWLWEVKRRPPPDGAFLPVPMGRLYLMWLTTFGLYGIYWFYKNFSYLRAKREDRSLPGARGFFYYFWYYPLFKGMQEDSQERFGKSILPPKALMLFLAIAFLLVNIAGSADKLSLLSLVLVPLLLLPLVQYSLAANESNAEALRYHSRWNYRHILLGFFGALIFPLMFGQELGLLPADRVVQGDKLWSHDVNAMLRRGVIDPADEIEYFYSDALFSMLKDGNGYTRNHVFSYWTDDNGEFYLNRAEFSEIQDIEVTPAKSQDENTVYRVIRKNGSDFIMFASNTTRGDQRFTEKLMSLWHENRN